MKILLIAGFNNQDIRQLNIFKKSNFFFHWLIRLFGLPPRVGLLNDSAPWITELISFFETRNDIELHVVGPKIRLKRRLSEFELRGVKYHLFSSEWTSFLRITEKYSLWKTFQLSGYYTRKILNKVKPDLVVLSGAENPAVAVSIFSAAKYPRYCLCQTVYNNPERTRFGLLKKINQETELEIFSQLRFFGVYSKLHYDLLKSINPDAIVFKFNFPTRCNLLESINVKKQYDFVNYALMHGERKGTPDTIKALAIVKNIFPKVTLNIVGGCDESIRIKLNEKVKDLGLEENVTFTPFFEKKSELLQHVQKSRFAVLPCKLDHISRTMTQSMQLGLPLVVYKTTGTPAFNREKECVLIAEKGNVEALAQHMLTLMEHPEKAELLARNAREYQEKNAERYKEDGERLIENFKAIIENYQHGTSIPQNQLFNPETED